MGWIFALGLLIYLAFAPLRLVIRADLDARHWRLLLEPGYHTLSLPGGSERALALRSSKDGRPPAKPHGSLQPGTLFHWLPGMLKALRYLLPRIQASGGAQIVFGSGDAAQSALLYGALNALNQTLQAVRPGKWKIFLGVDFSKRMLSGRIAGMIEFRAGHIMGAALIAALEYAKGRIHSWTNTPSKAL